VLRVRRLQCGGLLCQRAARLAADQALDGVGAGLEERESHQDQPNGRQGGGFQRLLGFDAPNEPQAQAQQNGIDDQQVAVTA